MNKENVLKAIDNHKPLIVNYGKGYFTDENIKEETTWDDDIQCYTSDTGIWATQLLIDIANGKVEDTKIELESE